MTKGTANILEQAEHELRAVLQEIDRLQQEATNLRKIIDYARQIESGKAGTQMSLDTEDTRDRQPPAARSNGSQPPYGGMTIKEAVIQFLRDSYPRAVATNVVTTALETGGVESSGTRFGALVYQALKRESRKSDGNVRRVGKKWRWQGTSRQ